MDPDDDVLYLFGGLDTANVLNNDLWAYRLGNDSWEVVSAGCQPGPDCPPPAWGSSLMQSGASGALTLALGTTSIDWTGTDHEWRYVTWQDRWVTEMEERGTWGQD